MKTICLSLLPCFAAWSVAGAQTYESVIAKADHIYIGESFTPAASQAVADEVASNDGTLSGGTTGSDETTEIQVAGPVAWLTYGLDLNGIDHKITLDSGAAHATTFSFAAWVKRDDGTADFVFGNSGDATKRAGVATSGGNNRMTSTTDNALFAFADYGTEDTDWHHLVYVRRSDNTVDLYADGSPIGTDLNAGTNAYTVDQFGVLGASTNWFNGKLSQLILSDEEFSDADVAALYAGPIAEAAYASPTLRKSLNMAADGGAWNWQRAFVQDAAVLSNPVEAGDMIVRRESDGLQVPAIVTQNDADGIDVNVLLPLTLRSTYEQYYLDVATAGTAAATSWPSFGVRQAAPTSGIDGAYTVYTGEDETGSSTSSAEFVHPFVVKVPSGSWASHLDSDLDGEVTHLIADTPYPGSNADYENPVLFYSTDNCATRARVPSTSIPWPLDGVPASGSNKDVCAFFLPESGDLVVSWSNPVDGAKFARISGTHLTDAAVDSEWANTSVKENIDSEFTVSPSYIALSDNRVRCYLTSPAPNDNDGCGSIYYRDTTNFLAGASATWTAEQQVSLAGGELDRGWWHGGICHDGKGGAFHDGYYYLIYSEGQAGQVATFDSDDLGSHARLFRSRSIDGPWEPALDVLIEHGGASTISEEGIYQIAISEDAAGKPFVVCSMKDAAGDYAVGRAAVDLRRTLVPTATAYNQGWGSASVYATASPLLAAVDFQRDTLSDASGNGNDATLTGSPPQTEGVGVVLDGSTQRIEFGSNDLLGGETYVDMGGLFTFPATFSTVDSLGVVLDNNPGSGGSFNYAVRLRVDPTTGQVSDYYWYGQTAAVGTAADIGPDLRGGTHFIRAIYDDANDQIKLFIDGAAYYTGSTDGALRANAANRIQCGAFPDLSNALDMTVHYVYVRTGGGPDYTFYRGGRGYALPAAETTTPKPLQQFPVFGR